jgi:hypothetical protein
MIASNPAHPTSSGGVATVVAGVVVVAADVVVGDAVAAAPGSKRTARSGSGRGCQPESNGAVVLVLVVLVEVVLGTALRPVTSDGSGGAAARAGAHAAQHRRPAITAARGFTPQ